MNRLLLTSLLSLLTVAAHAYKEETHQDMSQEALKRSDLQKSEVTLKNMGLLPISVTESKNEKFPGSDGNPRYIVELIRYGANFEDSGIRAINHFYNPVNGAKLSVPLPNYTSPDWALEDNGDASILGYGLQDYSYKDARRYLYNALTQPTDADRKKNFGLTFQTLGQVIHHLQDMAQPQHVRLDMHLDKGSVEIFGLQFNPLYNPSYYEIYSNQVRSSFSTLPSYPDLDFVTFTTPRSFWTNTQNKGMAQFTNSNFVSAGTNFDKPFCGEAHA